MLLEGGVLYGFTGRAHSSQYNHQLVQKELNNVVTQLTDLLIISENIERPHRSLIDLPKHPIKICKFPSISNIQEILMDTKNYILIHIK